MPLRDSPAERYLAQRGLSAVDIKDLNASLRYHPRCVRGKDHHAPAMVAAFRDVLTGEVVAIHRHFLTKANTCDGKMMLGSPKEAAVMLEGAPHDVIDRLYICEGVETAIGAHMLSYRPVWALGNAVMVQAFAPLLNVNELVVLADHDRDRTGIDAAEKCAATWREASWRADVIMPEREGEDFADVAGQASSPS